MNDAIKYALLALLNDDTRMEARKIAEGLQHKSSESVEKLLSKIIAQYSSNSIAIPSEKWEGEILQYIHRTGKFQSYLSVVNNLEKNSIKIVTYWDHYYPELLKKIDGPPLLLYINGKSFPGEERFAIVGTRSPTTKGKDMAYEFAKKLARTHHIVSGLAYGIDTAAHNGALDGGGKTLAILGNQVNTIYPKENEGLANKIMESGAVVTELTSLAYMHRGRFIERNRIISGISSKVIVGESSKEGGTIHQVRLALGQNRPVYILDHGRFQSEEAKEGFQKVVRMGGVPISDYKELFEKGAKSTQSTLF